VIIKVNGIDLYWEEVGDGEPLLWLHGGMGVGSDWRYVFPEPPAGYRLIAPDLRAHGASTNPPGGFTFHQCALDVQALVDHLGIERCKAIGMSGGGITLLHLALLRPDRITAMVVISAPPHFPEPARQIMRQLSEATLGEAEMARMRTRHKREGQVQELIGIMRSLADSYDDVNFTGTDLERISAGTLIVFGDRDPLYPVSMAVDLYNAIPRAALWVVPHGGHGPIFGDDATRFRDVALTFLRGLPAEALAKAGWTPVHSARSAAAGSTRDARIAGSM
jgi:pimeloyl-ACP methyl ester carboxylesterase